MARGAAIVSGGTWGIGREIAIELARRGWPVVAFGLEAEQPGSRAAKGIAATRRRLSELGLDAELLEADVASAGDVERVVAHALHSYGGISGLVNNAAIRPTGPILDTDEATFERVLAVNLKGPFLLCRAAIPHLRAAGDGAIVNVGSGAARGRAQLGAYAASKAGLAALTRSLADELRDAGIRVHLVVPPPATASGMTEAMGLAATSPPTRVARVVAALLAGDASARGAETVIDLASG